MATAATVAAEAREELPARWGWEEGSVLAALALLARAERPERPDRDDLWRAALRAAEA